MGILGKKNELSTPEALTSYYMDNYLCNEYLLQKEECIQRYNKKWTGFGKKKLYKQCLGYLDQYKACLIGMQVQHQSFQKEKHISEKVVYQRKILNRKDGVVTEEG